MAFLPLRQIESAARGEYDRWIGTLAEELSDANTDRYAFCRRLLTELYYPQYINAVPEELPVATRIALLQMDARNVTLEAEYYADIDAERFAAVKPLIWLWEMFDK